MKEFTYFIKCSASVTEDKEPRQIMTVLVHTSLARPTPMSKLREIMFDRCHNNTPVLKNPNMIDVRVVEQELIDEPPN